jgi:site-specific DNA recombinase
LTTKVAIYARHSTDKQTHSTGDQIARCEAYCEKVGYQVTLVFQDEAISGASVVNRPGVSQLIDAAVNGYFDLVVSEDLSRLSRDLGDIANFFRKLRFLDIGLETVSEGEITELHIGLKGTMNQLYLTDLGDKTRRGQIASVLKGSIPGGRTYGYDPVYVDETTGKPVKGQRKINDEQAAIIRWIFEQYSEGATLKRICDGLNMQQIESPKGGEWVNTTLIGQADRKTGLLRQTLYNGVVTFNRMMYRKNPDTGKRQSFLRPESEWLCIPVPELAIVDDKLFDQVQTKIEERSSIHRQRRLLNQAVPPKEKPAVVTKRKRRTEKRATKPRKINLYIFSGKLWCAVHDEPITVSRKHLYGCDDKSCNPRTLKHLDIMDAALKATEDMTVDQLKAAIDDQRHVRDQLAEEIRQCETELEEARKQIRNVLDAIAHRPVSEETATYLDDKEGSVLQIKYKLEMLKRKYKPISLIPDDEAQDVLKHFFEALAPLHDDPDNQVVTTKVYAWFDKFNVDPSGDELTVKIQYNWPRLFETLRKQESTPFFSRPKAILPRHAVG